jgi:5-methylcytosine-specific restriction endonuclease McrA
MSKKRSKKVYLTEPRREMYNVPQGERHAALMLYVAQGKLLAQDVLSTRRAAFDAIKCWVMPLRGLTCYTCPSPAKHRHHVIPLCRGGKNTVKNLVGLCVACHQNYDVMPKGKDSASRRRKKQKHSPAIPKQTKVLSSANHVMFVKA